MREIVNRQRNAIAMPDDARSRSIARMEVRAGSRELPPAAQVRKTVTIVFADLAGSTALGERLDPEALRDLQTRYFAVMRRALERHGGTVEKYIGDAVMAVFGIPVLHEEDALRAVRAAVEMRDAMAELNRELERDLAVGLELRVGINTGEVAGVDGATDHGFVSGDAVNTAARLQTQAPPGGIVIGAQTRRLVESGVRLRPHGSVTVKGKRRSVRVWEVERLIETGGRFRQSQAVPLVGRRAELRMLTTRFRRAVARDRCVLATAVGPAGIGKSRLLREFAAGIEDEATVMVGRCLPYGEGITYWPLNEIVNDLAGVTGVPEIEGLLIEDSQPQVVASRVAAATGRSGASATEADVQWAFRRLFEALARRRPLVVVFDDIHWAEPAMLDLIEHVAANAAAPILIVCLTRGDLLERRPDWEAAGGRGSLIRLQPLSDTDSARLLGRLAARRRAKVRREEVMYAAEGNPLFLEQLVAMRADDPGVRTPPTIQALLAARIDALPVPERRVIEAASIEGRGFHREAVRALVDEKRSVDAALASLVQRELIRTDRAEFSGQTGYRFMHVLVRDAAYDLLPKRRRADLHVAYADWLLGRANRGSAADEIVGYHLEQAYEYRSQLGRAGDDRQRELAARASSHLSDAGRRALAAGDRGGASNLLARAVALRARADPGRAALLIDLGGVHREQGRFRESEAALRQARALAVDARDGGLRAHAQVARLLSRLQVDPDAVGRLMRRQGAGLERELECGRRPQRPGPALARARPDLVDQVPIGGGRASLAAGSRGGAAGRGCSPRRRRRRAGRRRRRPSARRRWTPRSLGARRSAPSSRETRGQRHSRCSHSRVCTRCAESSQGPSSCSMSPPRHWAGSARRSTRRSPIRRCSWPCWPAIWSAPNGICGRGGGSSSRWGSGPCWPRRRAISRRSC